jgi:uncharacterized repeat protein (TIGR01451 family)
MSADLQVTITDGASTVVPGTVDTYTIVVTNNGTDTVSSVTVTDTIPAALSNVSFAPSVGTYDVTSGLWSGLSLASGDSISMTLSGTINPSATGTISNTVTVAPPAGVTDPDLTNNTATDIDTLPPFSTLNPSPPPGTSANMILRHGTDSNYEIYDIGNNSVLAAYPLGQVGMERTFASLGTFFGNDATDMMLRNSNNGMFEVYDISNNNLTNAAFLGTVGLDWQVMGFGNFSSTGDTDMMLRNANTGGIEVYDIRNNQIIGANFMGTVGLDWQVGGFGNFSSRSLFGSLYSCKWWCFRDQLRPRTSHGRSDSVHQFS